MEDVLTALISSSLEILLPIALTALAAWATAWFSKQRKLVEAKLTQEQLLILQSFAHAMVVAAEQSGLSGYIENVGEAKYEWVYDRIEAFCDENDIPIDVEQIKGVIEAAVYGAFLYERVQIVDGVAPATDFEEE